MATQDVAAASVAIANALPCQYDESAVPDDQNEQADGMQQADGMEEEDGIEEEDSDVVVMEQEDNASVNSTINSSITASSNSSTKSRRRLSLSTINGKRKAFGVERRIDLSINYLYTFVNTRAMSVELAEEGGWTRQKAPTANKHVSLAWMICAYFQEDIERRWYCQTTETCRDNNIFISTTSHFHGQRHEPLA